MHFISKIGSWTATVGTRVRAEKQHKTNFEHDDTAGVPPCFDLRKKPSGR
jgi:hypothetical protein